MRTIANCDAAINFTEFLDFFIDKESLKHRCWISHTSGLNNDIIDLGGVDVFLLHFKESFYKILSDSATDTAIHDFNNSFIFVFLELNKFVIDSYGTKLVFNDSYSLTVMLLQNSVKESGFS